MPVGLGLQNHPCAVIARPTMPINRALYPKDWPAIAGIAAILCYV